MPLKWHFIKAALKIERLQMKDIKFSWRIAALNCVFKNDIFRQLVERFSRCRRDGHWCQLKRKKLRLIHEPFSNLASRVLCHFQTEQLQNGMNDEVIFIG